jgi:hypothetical protein
VQPRIVVNAVLNAGAAEQVLLVERTLTHGRQCTEDLVVRDDAMACADDPADPIASTGGEPISGALVVVYGPAGDSAVALEDLAWRGDGKGAGVYRFVNSALDASERLGAEASLAIVPGERYRLVVSTPLGTVTAATTVPLATAGPAEPRLAFNVERGDFARRFSGTAAGAAGYLVVLDAATGRARRLFDRPVTVAAFSATMVAGDETVPGSDDRLAVSLYPGLPSDASVGAVDSNFRRALRAGDDEDPLSSENPGSSIEGGVGVFGSVVPLSSLRLDVVSFVDEPLEGRYEFVTGPIEAPSELRLFAYRGGLSGSFLPGDVATAALFGTRGTEPPLRLEFFSDRFRLARVGLFEGRFVSGELRGTFLAAGAATSVPTTYRRVP